MLCICYLRFGIVFVPTEALVSRGHYKTVGPATSFPVEATQVAIEALRATVARGNPNWQSVEPEMKIPGYLPIWAGFKTWGRFEKGMSSIWYLSDKANGNYLIETPRRIRGSDAWEPGDSADVVFPAGTDLDTVLIRLVTMMQAKAKE